MERISLGDIVVSMQGRDEGRIYLVVKVADPYLYLSDGNYRRQANPKKKKKKHIKPLSAAPTIGEKLFCGRQVFDSEIYSALKSYKAQESKAEE